MNDKLLIEIAELFGVDILTLKFISSNVEFLKEIGYTKGSIISSILIQCKNEKEVHAMMYLLGRSEQVFPNYILY